MPISFADQDLLLVDPALAVWLDRYLPTVETVLFSDFLGIANTNRCESLNVNAKNRVGIARPNYPAPPKLKINSLYWPTGAARWGRFLGICNTETKDKIMDEIGAGVANPGPAFLKLTDESTSPATELKVLMHLLPPRRLSHFSTASQPVGGSGQSSTDNSECVWLLPLVDERWLWQWTHETTTVSAGDTWEELIYQFLSGQITPDDIPEEYLFPDPLEFSRHGESVVALMDAVGHSLNQRFILKINGGAEYLNWDSSIERLDENLALKWKQIAGGDFDASNLAIQLKYLLDCPKYVTSVQSCGWYRVESELGDGEGEAKHIHSTVAANCDTFGDSNPGNQTELQALVAKLAEDHAKSLKFYDRTFAGLMPWVPCGFDDHIEWTIGGLHSDGTYLTQTRVQSHSYNFGIDEMLHQIEDRVFPPGNYIAKTVTSIPLMGGVTPGTGVASIYEWVGTELSDTEVHVDVRNMQPEDVAEDAWVQLKHDGCQLFVDVEACQEEG